MEGDLDRYTFQVKRPEPSRLCDGNPTEDIDLYWCLIGISAHETMTQDSTTYL